MIRLGNVRPTAKLLSREDSGINATYRGYIDTGSEPIKAYVKLLDGRQLVNELFANILGRMCGLPVPAGYLVRARPSDLDVLPESLEVPQEFLMYGSNDEEVPSLKRRIKTEALQRSGFYNNWPRIGAAAVFDDWIANADRHEGNLLVGSEDSIWLIDHGHAFTGPSWVPENFDDPSRPYANQLGRELQQMDSRKRDEAYTQSCECIQAFSQVDLALAVTNSQLDPTQNLIGAEDLSALVNFIASRVEHLLPIAKNRLGQLI